MRKQWSSECEVKVFIHSTSKICLLVFSWCVLQEKVRNMQFQYLLFMISAIQFISIIYTILWQSGELHKYLKNKFNKDQKYRKQTKTNRVMSILTVFFIHWIINMKMIKWIEKLMDKPTWTSVKPRKRTSRTIWT